MTRTETIRRRVKSGVIEEQAVRLAAYLGDQGARAVTGLFGPSLVEQALGWDVGLDGDGSDWIDDALAEWGDDVLIRAALAKDALYEESKPDLYGASTSDWRRALEAWTVCPCTEHASRLEESDPGYGCFVKKGKRAHIELALCWARETLCSVCVGEPPLEEWLERICEEVVSWALGDVDPVRARVERSG